MDQQLFNLGIIPSVEMPQVEEGEEASVPKYDYTLVKLETSLLNLSAGFNQSVGLMYFLAYPSETGRIFVR